ncbi:MAG TPA: TRAP transporter small permease [Devosia sp.]|uniref:TRAP transporter small permease n=1 Tax=Devosia sp. TaxID=1871048 RepID=UPI002DDCD036|nr:TRAP transporter small permease [Devosia sp.]HEV2514070.1 TRAP transporter small permease [Devosia sp.]
MDNSLLGRLVHGLAKAAAIAGGCVLLVATAITVASIIGRALIPLGLRPVPGDFELMQSGVLFAVFTFLPWCHLERGHAVVAIVTDQFPARIGAFAEFVWDLVMLAAAAFLAWRLSAGLLDKYGNGEATFILRLPVWISYSGGLAGALVFVAAAAYCAVRSGRNALSANPARPVSGAGE